MPVNSPLELAILRAQLDRAGNPWHMVSTSMTALNEQDRVVRLGVPLPDNIHELEQAGAGAGMAAATGAVGAPASFDLRNISGTDYTSPIENQGGCGSCVAFAVAATLECVTRYTKRTPSLPVDLSEAHLFYCYGRAAGATCGTGWWPDQALNAARDSGVTFADYFPYTAGDQDCSGLNADWPNHVAKVTAWQYLTNDPAAMKQYISTYGAISACFSVYQDFFSYGGGVYRHVSGALAGGHCVSLIGYDDAQGCWIAKNSWGPGWGMGGFFNIAYGECAIETYQVCGVQGVNLRTWLPNQQILGVWSNEVDDNMWAYASLRGWLKLDGAAATTGQSMLSELSASKAAGSNVGLFENNGQVDQLYAW